MKDYADITSAPSGDDSWRGENLQEFLKELIEHLPANLTAAEATFFVDKLSKDYQNPHYRRMAEYFAPRYVYLPADEKVKCEERLTRQWDKIIGDWMSENRLAESTRPLWGHLGGNQEAPHRSLRRVRAEQPRHSPQAAPTGRLCPGERRERAGRQEGPAQTCEGSGEDLAGGRVRGRTGPGEDGQVGHECDEVDAANIPDFEETVKSAVAKAAEEHAAM